ncbi:cation diffusion facilitator family transporter [Clostridium moniliforme]|uniref:Cation diffusion facilitator family transporter n=1 Tax=Clostridium moniliforme TaxID=39489 RepID=A0ABS4EYN6_9CLOT|nr:cation diffusion facilitator family transporter [Clostridium moniliforme]MBP1889109.1 cation diffusion facilitator family transporter [Clostridium moniliforme]
MFSKFLVKTFIKNSEDTKDVNVRNSYGFLGGVIGIIVNFILFIIKFSVGMLVSSIAVTADAFNNLSDAGSSVITIAGFKMANMPADEKHPFGHGRMEYLSALAVAFMVMLVGLQFVKSSFEKILHPEIINFEWIPFLLLIVSIFLKLWLAMFNKFIGKKIDSGALKASSVDALGDVFSSSCVAISILAAKFISVPIDGYIGIIVAFIIVYSGFTLVRETINPLLGEAPDPKLVKSIEDMMLSYDHIIGVHDLIVHNYGPGRCMASAHAEIPSDINIMEIHNIIDKAERDISKKLNIYLVIHMDPICLSDDEINDAYKEVSKIIKYNPLIKSFHDFRIVGEGNEKNLIFDIVVNSKYLNKISSEEKLKNEIIESIKEIHPQYNCIITIDHDYSEV